MDHLIKEGMIKTAPTKEDWLNYSAKRSKSTFQGARIEIENLGNNRFTAKTTHVDSYSIWLHPKMGVDFDQPIEVTTNGVTVKVSCTPSLLTALRSFERKEDWGLIYSARIDVEVSR